ncbi:hypothetical protein JCM19233_2844 [Vibrio astriarenae]|uniref:Uncharacterized protein n=1 Tax=Vibrio astriarenae TaxID=1481923 RepID=A0A7Z2YGB9_9VIBR|nr:hypothetical protein [Vibrio astriarenae]QIA65990.1 hypothetical protein GT360_21075 [Vibrio astriarenae]GAL11854.1 hypothetical protein JCM19233_2844 [Vibrio sp. C7]
MAVVPRHTGNKPVRDQYRGDMTLEQWHRFTRVANAADDSRSQAQSFDDDLTVKSNHAKDDIVKEVALMSVVRSKKHKSENIRYAIWISVAGLFFLWVMYMLG